MHEEQDKIKLNMEINVAAEKDNLNFCNIEKKKICLVYNKLNRHILKRACVQ